MRLLLQLFPHEVQLGRDVKAETTQSVIPTTHGAASRPTHTQTDSGGERHRSARLQRAEAAASTGTLPLPLFFSLFSIKCMQFEWTEF